MSWLVTAKTHSEIRDAIEAILRDSTNTVWTTAEIDQQIEYALDEVSGYVPYLVKDESLTFASATRELDISSVQDIIYIDKGEWLVDKTPPNYRGFDWLDAHTIRLRVDSLPASGDYCYLYLAKRHHLDPLWTVATAYVKGDFVSPTKANRTGYRYECTTAGTSHAATEPTWGTTVDGTTTDGTVTWTCRGEVPNSLHDGRTKLEDLFIELVAARCLINEANSHINTINVGSSKAMEQYLTTGNQRLGLVLGKLRGMARPRTKQWYPTD